MSPRFQTIRSNRRWMIESKLHPLRLTVTFYLCLTSSRSLLFNACLFLSIPLRIIVTHKFSVIHHHNEELRVCGWSRSCVRSCLCFFVRKICAYTLKEKTVKQRNYHCRRNQKQRVTVRVQYEREKEPNASTNIHTNAEAHDQTDPLILTSAALWDAEIYHSVYSRCVYERECLSSPKVPPCYVLGYLVLCTVYTA